IRSSCGMTAMAIRFRKRSRATRNLPRKEAFFMRHKPWSNRRITVFTLILTVLAIVLTLLLSLSNHCYTPRQTVHAVEQQALLHPTALAAKGAFPSLQDSSDNDRGWQ